MAQDLRERCSYLLILFKAKDKALFEEYSAKLAKISVEESSDFYHYLLLEYKKLVEGPASAQAAKQVAIKQETPAREAPKKEVTKKKAPKTKVTKKKASTKKKKPVKKPAKKTAKKVAKKTAKKVLKKKR